LFIAIAVVSAVAAVPFGARPMSSDRGWKDEAAVEIIDTGEGDIAAVIVAPKTVFEPFSRAVLTTSATRPRVIAFLVDRYDLESSGGTEGLSVPIAEALKQKGIRTACVVSCEECVPVAVRLAESLEMVSSLVLMTSLPAPTLPVAKTVYIASGGQDSLLGAIDRAMSIDDSEMPIPMPMVRRGGGFIPR
jgi:hypothetical protein